MINGQTDRQMTDKWRGRQIDRQTDRQTERYIDRRLLLLLENDP